MMLLLIIAPCTNMYVTAQVGKNIHPPGDAELLALVSRYVKTPVIKTVSDNGDVFLQRDLSAYLSTNVFRAQAVPQSEMDFGHDHKDAMLREFLHRPQPAVATLNRYFQEAANEFHVPVSILKAAAQVQSNWAQVSESMYGSWGVMGIIENNAVHQITEAAQLLRTTKSSIQNDAQTNIRAAAALLANYQRSRPAATNLADWFASVKELTGLRDLTMQNELAVRIFNLIQSGSKSVTLWGEIIQIEPVDVHLPQALIHADEKLAEMQRGTNTVATDYPNAVSNFTTCNFNNRPPGATVNFYFVHYVATGTYQGAIDWFKNCTSNVSAHYVIRNNDGEVSQVVAEANRAYSQGVTLYNDQGIGVEHEVLATNLAMWDSEPMLVAAASLCVNVCNRWAIPKVRRINNGDRGIYGHSDVRLTDCPNLTAARWQNFLNRLSTVSAAPPTLYSVRNSGSGTEVTATWKANIEPTLAGYRLYYATNDALTTWALAANETTLTAGTTLVTIDASNFIVPPAGNVYHFKLTAVVADGSNPLVESAAGDIYSRSSNTAGPKVLIVDGFDRTNGSYTRATHSFITNYFKAMRNQAALQISSAANEKIEDGTIPLAGYDFVVWFVGDESSANVVLSPAERTALKNYLDGGGKLIFSGSEVGYNVGRSGGGSYDLNFMNNYLKSTYVNDGAITYTPATGIAGTPFEGLDIPFGITYVEDFPDAINAANGAVNIFNYAVSPNKAGIAYKGTFGTGTVAGGVIFLGFTLETAQDSSMSKFMQKALAYFDVPTVTKPTVNDDAGTANTATAKRINILANDDNNGVPFNLATLTIVNQPSNGNVTITANGYVTYISAPGFAGTDQFTYRLQNTIGTFSDLATVVISVTPLAPCDPAPAEVEDRFPKRDLRGAWVSTVSNIDWPSARTLTTTQQQTELINILDTLSKTGINSVFLQVRPESDALYASSFDPWSYWLTGAQGTAPSPFWDPLEFAIAEAHKRGMELHAWLNPYRAKQSTPTLAANHVAVLHPEWTFISGSLTLLNPGLPDVRSYVTKVVGDIARRYDVDGIHFDDYFYPYGGMAGQDNQTYIDFNPTSISTIEDWRRNNVNMLIARVYDTITQINAAKNGNVVFGVSPFGIWKSGVPAGISGTSSYSVNFCDPIAWLQAGKVDYLAPQLYWKVSGPQDYLSLSKWWNDQGASNNRPIYPGLALYRMADISNWAVTDITNQLYINRDLNHENTRGQIFFSSKYISLNTKDIKNTLRQDLFKYPALPPAFGWKDAVCPNAPLNFRRDADSLRWDVPSAAADGDLPEKYVVYRFANAGEMLTNMNDGTRIYAIVQGNSLAVPPADMLSGYFAVTALDKNNNESPTSPAIVLPVTGLVWDVQLSGNTAIVNWKTLTEINTRSFEVERSTDGRTFVRLTTVAAAGSSALEKRYKYDDFLPAPGTYYYRIKSIDNDSRYAYSEIKRVVYKGGNNIMVGPNPFSNYVNIANLVNVARIDVVDGTGRVILAKKVNGETTLRLDLPNLPAGMYHVKFIEHNGSFTVTRLIKL